MSNINDLLAKPNSSCSFCKDSTRDDHQMGQLLSVSNDHNAYHYYCLLFSSGLMQRGNDEEGILGFLPQDINKEIARGKKLACVYCSKKGATIGCFNSKCRKSYHMSCGLKHNAQFSFLNDFRSWCKDHRILQRGAGVMSRCQICLEESSADPNVALCAPCCRKDIWYHKKCMQDLAISSGYYFKCPLCNDKSSFVRTMQQFGIYVPEKDASWELEPNAYDDLLERPFHCEAALCLCDMDREYDKEDTPWEIQYCDICGSSGIHKKCMSWIGLKVWQCISCVQHTTDILKRERLKYKEQNKNEEVMDNPEDVKCEVEEVTTKSEKIDDDMYEMVDDVFTEEDTITVQNKEIENEENLMETAIVNIEFNEVNATQEEEMFFGSDVIGEKVLPEKNINDEPDEISVKSREKRCKRRKKKKDRNLLNVNEINESTMKNHPEENEEQPLEGKDSDYTYSDSDDDDDSSDDVTFRNILNKSMTSEYSQSKSVTESKEKVIKRPCCLCSDLDLHSHLSRHIRRKHRDVLQRMTKGAPKKQKEVLTILRKRGIFLYNHQMTQNGKPSENFLEVRKSTDQKRTPRKTCKRCRKLISIVKFESHNCDDSTQRKKIVESSQMGMNVDFSQEEQIQSNIFPYEHCPEYYKECISRPNKDTIGMLVRNTKDILYVGKVLFKKMNNVDPMNRRFRIGAFLRRLGILYNYFIKNVVEGPSSFVNMFKVEHTDIFKDAIGSVTQNGKLQSPVYLTAVNTCCDILLQEFSLSNQTEMKEQISLFKNAIAEMWKKNFKNEISFLRRNYYYHQRKNYLSKKY